MRGRVMRSPSQVCRGNLRQARKGRRRKRFVSPSGEARTMNSKSEFISKPVSTRGRTSSLLLKIILKLLVVAVLAVNCQSGSGQDLYVQLPKLGYLRGYRLSSQVAAYLGVPYAAPPTGLLRFMPPGALNAQRSSNSSLVTAYLMPERRRAQVRDHALSQRHCVQLSDWLGEEENNKLEEKRSQQSEDCLSLSLLVPLKIGAITQSYYPIANQTTSRNKDPLNKDRLAELWPLTSHQQGPQTAPVLVVFDSNPTTNIAASYLELAESAHCLVVTFNWRQGLLGFLPFADEDLSLGGRYNHAIWDQIGLLHWLKHNVNSFGGNSANITLLAADNRAAQLVQVLASSPQAKGLFQRVVIVHDETRLQQQGEAHLNHLLKLASEARDLRRRLAATLTQIVHEQQRQDSKLLDYLQAANLSQLARLDQQLRSVLPEKLLDIATGPNLDDKLLFPHLASLIKNQNQLEVADKLSGDNNQELKSQLQYCAYMRRLVLNSAHDPLALVPSSHTRILAPNAASRAAKLNDSHWTNSIDSTGSQRFKSRKTTVAANFQHLYHLHLLNQVLNLDQSDQEDDDLQEEDYGEQGETRLKHSISIGSNKIENSFEQTFELMFGYMKPSSTRSAPYQALLLPFNSLNNIANTLLNSTTYFNYPFIAWMKLADLHFTSRIAGTDTALANYCDFITPKKMENLKTFMFLMTHSEENGDMITQSPAREATTNHKKNWLLESLDKVSSVIDNLIYFVKFGSPGDKRWPSYDLLGRRLKIFSQFKSNETRMDKEEQKQEQQRVHSQIVIHLELLPYLANLITTRMSQDGANSDQLELQACLSELDSAINKSRSSWLEGDEVKCITKMLAKFRTQLRHLAANDIEVLLTHSSRSAQKQLGPSSITTRNLVNQNEQFVQQQQTNLSNGQFIASESAENPILGSTLNSDISNSSDSTNRGFLMRAYKEAAARPLALIIMAGGVIFLINLVIVLVIHFGSANGRHRSQQQEEDSPAALSSVDMSNGLQLVGTKKSTLKRASETLNNSNVVQLTSAIRSSNGSGTFKAKQLKFDLPLEVMQVQLHNHNLEHQEHLNAAQGGHYSPQEDEGEEEDEEEDEGEEQLRQLVEANDNSNPNNNELVLSTAAIMSPYGTVASPNQQLVLHQQSPVDCLNYYHHHHHQQHLCSPFASQSTTTSGNTTTYGHQHSHHNQRIIATTASQHQQQSSGRLPNAGRRLASQQSPDSSTTLSMTPIQLESFTASHSGQLSSPNEQQTYQLEPVSLIPYHPNQQQLSALHEDQLIGGGNKMLVLSPSYQNFHDTNVSYCAHHHNH